MKLIIGATAFLITCTTTAPLIGAINKTDTQNLKETLKLNPLSHFFGPLLNITEKPYSPKKRKTASLFHASNRAEIQNSALVFLVGSQPTQIYRPKQFSQKFRFPAIGLGQEG